MHPWADNRDWTLVGCDGGPTRDLKAARLYPFSKLGVDAALEDGQRLHAHLRLDDQWTPFLSRVLVEGPWEDPEEVTAVWVIEGLERPVPVRYHFL